MMVLLFGRGGLVDTAEIFLEIPARPPIDRGPPENPGPPFPVPPRP